MNKQKKWIGLSLALAIILSMTACGGTAEQNTLNVNENKDSVIISMDAESEPTEGFDPILGWAAGEHTHDPLFQSTLLVTNDDLTIGNDLATDYEISMDGKTWTFTIRDDVAFTDGQPLTASDVAFTYNMAKAQVTETDLSMLDSVVAFDDKTVIFHMNKPYSAFAYTAAVVGIVPEHAYDPGTYGQNPIGSGRYVLKQWNKGEQVILEANPDYYGREARIKRVTVVFMSEEASYAAALGGQIDVAYTAPEFTQNPVEGYRIQAFDSVDVRGINLPVIPAGGKAAQDALGESFPAGNDITCDLAVRQALALAVDREALVRDILYGYGAPAYSESHGEPWENQAMKNASYDPKKAKEIMEAGGWQLGTDGIYEKDGKKAEFNLLYMSSNSVRTGLAMAVAEKAKAVGIKINPKGASWDEISSLYYETPHVFGAGMHSPTGMISHYYTGKNGASYSNPSVDGYIDLALGTASVEESYPLWSKAHWDGTGGVTPEADAPWLWLVEIDHIYFVREGIHVIDNKIHPHGYGWAITNNVDQWFWE